MKPLYSHIEDYYQGCQLNYAKLETLLAAGRRHQPMCRWIPLSLVAGVVLLLFASALVYQTGVWNRDQAMLQEASVNHLHKLELEFIESSVHQLDARMDKLDFPVRLPGELARQYTVTGARYCALGGELAAHIRMRSPTSGQSVSLFMAKTDNATTTRQRISKQFEAVEIVSWAENGMLYMLASDRN